MSDVPTSRVQPWPCDEQNSKMSGFAYAAATPPVQTKLCRVQIASPQPRRWRHGLDGWDRMYHQKMRCSRQAVYMEESCHFAMSVASSFVSFYHRPFAIHLRSSIDDRRSRNAHDRAHSRRTWLHIDLDRRRSASPESALGVAF